MDTSLPSKSHYQPGESKACFPSAQLYAFANGRAGTLSAEIARHAQSCPSCAAWLDSFSRATGDAERIWLGERNEILRRSTGYLGPTRVASPDDLLKEAEWLREHALFDAAAAVLVKVQLMHSADGRIQARCCLARARLDREVGRFEEAEAELRALLALGSLGLPERITAWNILAWLTMKIEGGDDAVEDQLRAAEACVAGLSSEAHSREISETKHQRAVHCMNQGNLAEAELLVNEALALRERFDGPERLDVARSKILRGAILARLGRFDDALELHLEALKIRQAAVGKRHADVADVQAHIGELFKSQGRQVEAAWYYEQAEASLLESSPTLLERLVAARCHVGLAEVSVALDDLVAARYLADKAMPILELLPGCYPSALAAAKRIVTRTSGGTGR